MANPDISKQLDEAGLDTINMQARVGALAHGQIGQANYFGQGAPVSISTAGNVTYTAAQLYTGTIVRDTNGAARTDTLDTAAAIVAQINSVSTAAVVGDRI